jgi:uncharacterized protein (TIGR02246 family)
MARSLALPVFLAGALALGGCATPPPAPAVNAPDDIAAVNALRTKFQQMFGAGDAAAVGNLYTVDAFVAYNHQPTAVGRDAIVKANTDFFAQFSVKLELTPEETKTMGDFGYDRGRFTFTVTPKTAGMPAPPVDEGRYLVLLKKDTDGQWRVSHDIGNSSLPMPMPAPEPAAKKGGKK